MISLWENQFLVLYKKYSVIFPELVRLDEVSLKSLSEDLRKTRHAAETRDHVIISTSLFISVSILILVIPQIYWFINHFIIPPLSNFPIKDYLADHYEYGILFLVFAFFGVFFTIAPIVSKIRNKPEKKGEPWTVINIRRPEFIFYCFTYYYLLILSFLFAVKVWGLLSDSHINLLILLWIGVLGVMFIVAAFFFIAVLLVLPFKMSEQKFTSSATITLELLKLLDAVEKWSSSPPFLDENGRSIVLEQILEITNSLNRVNKTAKSTDETSVWIEKQMSLAADNFLNLAAWVYFPQPDTGKNLKIRVCKYINIFLSGNYHALPREEITNDSLKRRGKLPKSRKLLSFVFLVIYMILPILVVGILIYFFEINIHPFVQSTLSIFYVIWIIFGLFFFTEEVNPDVKTFMLDLVKSFVNKT